MICVGIDFTVDGCKYAFYKETYLVFGGEISFTKFDFYSAFIGVASNLREKYSLEMGDVVVSIPLNFSEETKKLLFEQSKKAKVVIRRIIPAISAIALYDAVVFEDYFKKFTQHKVLVIDDNDSALYENDNGIITMLNTEMTKHCDFDYKFFGCIGLDTRTLGVIIRSGKNQKYTDIANSFGKNVRIAEEDSKAKGAAMMCVMVSGDTNDILLDFLLLDTANYNFYLKSLNKEIIKIPKNSVLPHKYTVYSSEHDNLFEIFEEKTVIARIASADEKGNLLFTPNELLECSFHYLADGMFEVMLRGTCNTKRFAWKSRCMEMMEQ